MPGKCADDKGIEVQCVVCENKDAGCKACKGSGRLKVSGCVQSEIGPGIAGAIQLFDLYKQGLSPTAGGVLDQAAWFVDAYQWFQNDVETFKAEALK